MPTQLSRRRQRGGKKKTVIKPIIESIVSFPLAVPVDKQKENKQELKNTSICMEVSIKEGSIKKTAYTDREKFELLSSLNNNLNTLAQEFRLHLN